MQRAESYAALAPLLSAQLRRGVVTNCFLSAEDYRRELANGLFYEQGEGFLLLFRQRQGHLLLNFYLHPDAVLRLPALRVPVVTELACREKDRAAMRWAQEADDTRMQAYFYPETEKSALFSQGYIAERSGHSRGSTVDLTLFELRTGREADMGGTFDYFGARSHADYSGISAEQSAMRALLRDVMVRHGFRPYAGEWWHFTLENEPYPDTYFTFPVSAASLAGKAA